MHRVGYREIQILKLVLKLIVEGYCVKAVPMIGYLGMRNYQLVLILKPSLKDSERKKTLDGIKSFLKDVKIAKEEEWGQKPLTYEIKHENTGFYVNLLLEVKSVLPSDLEKRIYTNEDVLRHLILRSK